MKRIAPLFLLVVFFLASCSSEETIQQQETSLKSYKVSRDSQGRYSIDYEVKENTTTNFTKNLEDNTNEIHIFEGNTASKTNQTEALTIENSLLKLGLYENGEKSKSIVIEDDNILLAKGEESDVFLERYSVIGLENDYYQLDFEVKEGVIVWSEYNEDEDAYEIHLKEGISGELVFSKSYVKTSELLKINFVNHNVIYKSKSVSEAYLSEIKKPRLIVN